VDLTHLEPSPTAIFGIKDVETSSSIHYELKQRDYCLGLIYISWSIDKQQDVSTINKKFLERH
jgi:hypothetical protein